MKLIEIQSVLQIDWNVVETRYNFNGKNLLILLNLHNLHLFSFTFLGIKFSTGIYAWWKSEFVYSNLLRFTPVFSELQFWNLFYSIYQI